MSFACLGFRSFGGFFVFLFCFIFFFPLVLLLLLLLLLLLGVGGGVLNQNPWFSTSGASALHLSIPVPAWFNGLWNQWWHPLSLSWSRWLKCYIGSRNRQNDHWDLRMTLSKMTTSPLATHSTWYTHVMPVLCIETGRFPALNKIDENNILQAISSDTDLFQASHPNHLKQQLYVFFGVTISWDLFIVFLRLSKHFLKRDITEATPFRQTRPAHGERSSETKGKA